MDACPIREACKPAVDWPGAELCAAAALQLINYGSACMLPHAALRSCLCLLYLFTKLAVHMMCLQLLFWVLHDQHVESQARIDLELKGLQISVKRLVSSRSDTSASPVVVVLALSSSSTNHKAAHTHEHPDRHEKRGF